MRAALVALLLGLFCDPLPGPVEAQAPPHLAPPEAVERIAALLAQNDPAAASAAATRALATYPTDPHLHNLAGVGDAQQAAYASAESHFLTAIRLAPRVVAPYLNLGRLYQERTAVEPAARAKAREVYRQLLAVDPSNVEGLYQAALLGTLDGAFQEARGLIARLPAHLRGAPQVLAITAVNLEQAGDASAAGAAVRALASHERLTAADIVALLPAFEGLPDSELPQRLIEALDARGQASASLLQQLGAIHTRRGRFAEARRILERAAAAGPTVSLLTDLARVAVKLGDPKGALGYLAHARSLEPGNGAVHFLFGIVCVQLDLGREAYDSLAKAVEIEPENPLVNYAMGSVAIHRHDPSEAVPYFEKYVRLRPDDPRGRFALGAARFYSGQLEGARADLEVAARSGEARMGAHFFLARIARQTNDLAGARRAIDEALRLDPKHADSWAELGLIQMRAGQYREAEASIAEALALEPENYNATLNLAALYGRTKDPRRAAQEARLAALIARREARTQEFLRIIEVVP